MRLARPARVFAVVLLVGLPLFSPSPNGVAAQEIAQDASVPRLVQFGGRVADPAGRPLAGVVDLTFAFYASQDAVEPLWSETQSVQLGEAGQYTVMLGAASPDGIPRTLFASGEARWLGVKLPDGNEQPRLLLLSVPYALKAADAETLGGKPASAYLLAGSSDSGRGPSGNSERDRADGVTAAAQGEPEVHGIGTANFIAKWQSTDEIKNSGIFENASGNVGIGTTSPGSKLTISSPTFGTVVLAESTYTAGNASVAIRGVTSGTNSAAIVAESNASTGFSAALVGNANAGMGVSGESLGVSGYGVRGKALGSGGVGVYGQGDNSTVSTGVLGISEGTSGRGVDARANATTGLTYGVLASSVSSSGTAIAGVAGASSGNTFGLQAIVSSPAGVAARLENNGGGNLLIGRVSGADKFKVDGAGAVYASSYRDIAGNPIPAGDLTSIIAGAGLSGGGASGDVTLSFNTAFGDARYSLLGHGHSVSEVSGAATLGANSFAGNQTIAGDVVASGKVEAASSATFLHAIRGVASGTFGVGVKGEASGSAGSGVRGEATGSATSGVLGIINGSNGSGVRGDSTATTGVGTGVRGASAAEFGTGLYGEATSTVGQGIGTRGQTSSPNGMGVMGYANATTGQPIGVRAVVESTGIAGTFENVTGSGDLIVGRTGPIGGVYTNRFRVDTSGNVYADSYRDLAGNPIPSGNGDITAVSAGAGLSGGGVNGDVTLALNTTFTDGRYSLLGHGHVIGEVAGAATLGANTFTGTQNVTGNLNATGEITGASSGQGARALRGDASGLSGVGVEGNATGEAGEGVRGIATGFDGLGIQGLATHSTGPATGVAGSSSSSEGIGVLGTGHTGVRGDSTHPGGVAGLFTTAGTDLLRGEVQGTPKFRVDGTGAVYATEYRDLAGNPIPSGTGDITGVVAGTGLAGGGAAGDVSLTLDTSFTDGRYSLLNHGHTVSQVSGAATLGANSFTGNQSVSGDVIAIGKVEGATTASAQHGVRGTGTGSLGFGVRGDATGTLGTGVFGTFNGSNGSGVRGQSSATTGVGVGVRGSSAADVGTGLYGEATSTVGQGIGTRGQTSSPNGMGVMGYANATTGQPIGVRAVVESIGIAGTFENVTGSGDLIVGRTGPIGGVYTNRFRVDTSGNVYAGSYRDLGGNPIPSGNGDITAVAAGTGLAGGGAAGDVSLSLDTAFTDGRYAFLNHGHTVSQVTGAATLGANTFNGNQSVTGDIIASGKVEAAASATFLHALRGTASGTFGLGVKGEASGTAGSGVKGEATGSANSGVFGAYNGSNGSGVRGDSTATTGVGIGVRGTTAADFGTGIDGRATSTSGQGIGARGETSSPNGMGVLGYASASTGQPVGVRAVVESTGIAGTFEMVNGSGDLIVGRTGPISGVYTNRFRVDTSGNVYASTFNPGGADFAESVEVSGIRTEYEPGDVMIIDASLRRTMQKSSTPYSTMVSGIYSTKPGVLASPHGADDPRLASEIPLAVIGIVPCKVSAENGAIAAGDLLVTASLPGYAMKGTDRSRMLGAVVGKALESLHEGTGLILVLVTLQ